MILSFMDNLMLEYVHITEGILATKGLNLHAFMRLDVMSLRMIIYLIIILVFMMIGLDLLECRMDLSPRNSSFIVSILSFMTELHI